MLACGLCRSVLGAESRPTGDSGKRLRVYWCRSNRHGRRVRGATCPNNVVVPMRLLDQAVLQTIEPYLTPDVIADAVAAAVKRAGSRATVDTERVRLERGLRHARWCVASKVPLAVEAERLEEPTNVRHFWVRIWILTL